MEKVNLTNESLQTCLIFKLIRLLYIKNGYNIKLIYTVIVTALFITHPSHKSSI